jgi:hypothetical protein
MGPTDTEATKQPIVPALDNRLWWLWSYRRNEWLVGETEVHEENLPQFRLVHKSHVTWSGFDPGRLIAWAVARPFMKLSMCIMARGPISKAHFINPDQK